MASKIEVELKGQVERITFKNEENGYTIAKLKVKGKKDLITVVGTISAISPGEMLRIRGYWDSHPKYGEQIKILHYETILPATAKGIEKYLGSGLIKGIGPVMARRLVTRFKEDTLNIIEEDIERLREVEGIGEKRIEMIKKAWEEHKEIRDVMIFLQSHSISPAYAIKIYRYYGSDSIRIVKENPYRLAMDIYGIGFKTADKIAEKIGIPKDSILRAEAGIMHVLYELSEEGHIFYPYELLIKKCSEILEVDESKINYALELIVREGKVVLDNSLSFDNERKQNDTRIIYLTKFYISETGIAKRIKKIMSTPKQLRLVNLDEAINWVQNLLRIEFSNKQKEAIKEAINSKVMIITGGPGTGKTTIIKAIIEIYRAMNQRILLAAPTGRAAKRVSNATGYEAKTIHRLLEFSPSNGAFKRNETNPLNADIVIIDETSMVDTVLMYHLLKAIRLTTTIIFVGDKDQLPSVGAGNVLKDLIDSREINTVKLDEIFRQSKESMIIVNAHRINRGDMPYLFYKDHLRDFIFTEIHEPEEVLRYIVYLCSEIIPNRFGFNPIDDVQVITPMYKGTVGVSKLNEELQKVLNKNTETLVRWGKTFKIGDKVMQLRNNYNKDVYNGDIGKIISIDKEFQEVKVQFDDKSVTYDFSELDEITLAYAISVHKSQGSEYPVVILPVLTHHYIMLQRNLLYTAITRGKKLVFMVGSKRAIAMAVKNNKPLKRYTMLKERLIGS